MLLTINDKILNEILEIRVDDSYFIYVDVVEVSKVIYLPNTMKGLKIVRISLETEEREPIIRIRGNEKILRELRELTK